MQPKIIKWQMRSVLALSSQDVNERMKTLEKGLKLDTMSAFSMSSGEISMVHRLNLIISLMTMILDEIKEMKE
jgi:hypothetical protein